MAKKKLPAALIPLGFGSLLLGGLVLLSRCFSPDLPACSFVCGTEEPRCPTQYECRSDGYCHLSGSTEACPYTMDLSPAPARPDLSSSGDMATPPDMTVPPDMTTPTD